MRSLPFREGLGVGSLLFHALFHCFTPQSFCRKNSEEGHKGYKGEWKGIKGSRDGFYSPSASRRKAEGLARTQAGVEPLLKNQESILKPRRGGRIILSGLRRLNTNVHYSQGLHPCLCSCQAFGLFPACGRGINPVPTPLYTLPLPFIPFTPFHSLSLKNSDKTSSA